ADVDVQRLDDLRPKSGRLRTDAVPAGGNRADAVVPFEIGDGGHGEIDRVVADADHGRWDHRARFVDDASLENRRGLRLHGRRGAQHHECGHRSTMSRDLPPGARSAIFPSGEHGRILASEYAASTTRDQRNTYRISGIATT